MNVYPAGNRDPQETSSDCWTFDVDTLGPPPPPGVSLVPGENRVQVSWDPIDDPDIEFYEVVYCVTATTADITLAPPCESEQQLPPVQVASTLSEASIQDGIRLPGPDERVFVVVAVRSIDDFDNSGVESEFTTVEPQEVLDFFELYDGGRTRRVLFYGDGRLRVLRPPGRSGPSMVPRQRLDGHAGSDPLSFGPTTGMPRRWPSKSPRIPLWRGGFACGSFRSRRSRSS